MTRSIRRFVSFLGVALLTFGVVGACSAPDERPPTSEDPDAAAGSGGNDSAAGAEVGDAGGVDGDIGCVVGRQLGNVVQQQILAGPMPVNTGGSIVPGTYVLTQMNAYVGPIGPSGVAGQYTLLVTPVEFVVVGDRVAGAMPAANSKLSMTLKYSASSSNIQFSVYCPQTAAYPRDVGYTATPTTLSLSKNDTDVEFFTKQ